MPLPLHEGVRLPFRFYDKIGATLRHHGLGFASSEDERDLGVG